RDDLQANLQPEKYLEILSKHRFHFVWPDYLFLIFKGAFIFHMSLFTLGVCRSSAIQHQPGNDKILAIRTSISLGNMRGKNAGMRRAEAEAQVQKAESNVPLVL
ncbi:hypothetical protein ACJX0J_023467, partial [Zea mays]